MMSKNKNHSLEQVCVNAPMFWLCMWLPSSDRFSLHQSRVISLLGVQVVKRCGNSFCELKGATCQRLNSLACRGPAKNKQSKNIALICAYANKRLLCRNNRRPFPRLSAKQISKFVCVSCFECVAFILAHLLKL